MSLDKNTIEVTSAESPPPRTRARACFRGCDPVLLAMLDRAGGAAQRDCHVLVVGEVGTEKDALARMLHQESPRAAGPFVAVHCGGFPRELIAPELFGHERGAFPGALAARDGYVMEADGGTLFLDGLDELSLEMQQPILRVLESRAVRRVGGTDDRPVNVRIVAAVNQRDGLGTAGSRLRLELYHRLATVVLALPPLRERIGDLVGLVEAMLAELVVSGARKRVSNDGWRALAAHRWPGNLRELRHAVWRAVAFGGNELGPLDFFPPYQLGRRGPMGMPPPADAP